MRKYFIVVLLVSAILIFFYGFWSMFFEKHYTIKDIELNKESITKIQRHFGGFELPKGAKVVKATKVIQSGTWLYAKVLVPVDKIDEFNYSYSVSKPVPLTKSDFKVHTTKHKMLKWWVVNEGNADYLIRLPFKSTEFTYCKPENGMIAVYIKD